MLRMHSTWGRQRMRLAQLFINAKAALARQTRALPQQERIFRTNFVLHLMNGAFSGFSDALTSSTIVMTAFLSQLTTSNILIALLSPLRDAGWFLPQFFLAPWIEHTRRKVTAYRAGTLFRLGAWIALVICIFTIR